MTARAKWVGAIVGLLVFNVVATGVLIAASHHGASRVIPAYYEQAIRYDDVIAQAAHNVDLGWRVDAAFVGGSLEVTVRDRDGAPLDGAHVRVTGYRRADGSPIDARLIGGGGMYRKPVAHQRGWHDLTIAIERGRDSYLAREAIEAR